MAIGPLVSIVVPVYNVGECIEYCLASLLEQTYRVFEILLIDDGSTDYSGDLCDAWAQRDHRIRVFHKANGGLSDARNYGIDRANGEYVTCVDSDDYVNPNYLSTLISALASYPEYGMVGCKIKPVSSIKAFDLRENPGKCSIKEFTCKDAFKSVLYNDEVDVSACGKLYRRSLIRTIKYPVGQLYEDTFVFGTLLHNSEGYLYIDSPLYYYVKRKGSIVNTGWSESKLDYIDAVGHLVTSALACSDELRSAAIRKETQAYLSVLRYTPWRIGNKRILFDSFREKALAHADEVLCDCCAPRRDKIALMILRLGLKPYCLCWGLYQWVRTFARA